MEEKSYMKVDSVETLEAAIARVRAAQKKYATYTQEQVDKIFLAAAIAADKMRIPLAKLAVEETGMGVVEDKVIKNHYAAEYIYNKYPSFLATNYDSDNIYYQNFLLTSRANRAKLQQKIETKSTKKVRYK